MVFLWTSIALIFVLFFSQAAIAHVAPTRGEVIKPNTNQQASYRFDCQSAEAQIDLAINNVRARLTTGGDIWWNGSDGRYVIPKVAPGEVEVASIFAGGLWLGGVDPGGNLKTACQTYGHFAGNDEFWPGPLSDEGSTSADTCLNWDRFFRVLSSSVAEHQANWTKAQNEGRSELELDEIPDDVQGWPGLGNPFFFDIHGFELPSGNLGFNGLADFWDVGGSPGVYEPQFGDFPFISINNCGGGPVTPDEMLFWIINDAGGIHANTNGDAIQMEIQTHAFAFQSSTALNDMTFYKYQLINRAIEDIDETYLGVWVDADLGCFQDDYIGCDTTRSLAYAYNADALDGNSNCNDCSGVPTYCEDIPVVGVDFLQGPVNEFGERLEMSSFTYYDNAAFQPNPALTDPQEAPEFYNYLSGKWRDGTPLTTGGIGYNPASTNFTSFAFSGAPNDFMGWSMCSENIAANDSRTIQSAGPFTLKPGAINNVFTGVVWVPSMTYPCPDLSRFFEADDLAQSSFDNCFEGTIGVKPIEIAPELQNIQILPNRYPVSSAGAASIQITDLPEQCRVSIYDLNGRLMRQYAEGSFSSTLEWDLTDQRGNAIAKGMYLIQVKTEANQVRVLKFMGI